MAVLKESPVAITEGLLGPVGGDDGEHGIYITSLNYDNNSKGWKFFSFYRTGSTGSRRLDESFKVTHT